MLACRLSPVNKYQTRIGGLQIRKLPLHLRQSAGFYLTRMLQNPCYPEPDTDKLIPEHES